MDSELFYKELLKSIQHCYELFFIGDNPNLIYKNILLELLKVSDSQHGFISEYIECKEKSSYFHHIATTNILWNMDTLFGASGITKQLVILNNIVDINSFVGIPLFFKKKFIGIVGISGRENGYNNIFINKIQPFINTISYIVGSSNQSKNNFFAKVTHDIRTPIGAIIGISALLKKNTTLNKIQNQYVNIIENCSDQLLSLINNLLDSLKCNEGQMNVCSKALNLKKCLNDVYNIISTKANEKNINICYIIDNDVPRYIISDENKIKQILINLLSNAIKFTNSGVILTYIRVKFNCNVVLLKFSIYDTGIGIEKKNIDNIFSIYNQIENEYNNTNIGTGLGLSICTEFTKLLGGKIAVNSTFGKGSEFYFTIEIPYNKLKNRHVIMVNNKTINYINYKKMFNQIGMDIHTFSNNGKVIKYIENNINFISVVFIYIYEPIMDQIKLAQKIKLLDSKIILISITTNTMMKWNEYITFFEIFDKNLYAPINIKKIQSILSYIMIKFNDLEQNNTSKYESYKTNIEKSKDLWFYPFLRK